MVEIKTRCRIPIWRTFGRIPWHAIREPPATLQGAVTWRNQCHDRATFFAIFNFLLFFNAVRALTSSGFRIVLFYTGCVFWIILPLCPICFFIIVSVWFCFNALLLYVSCMFEFVCYIKTLCYVTCMTVFYPRWSWRQATPASTLSKPSSHTVPHVPLYLISKRPSCDVIPPTSLKFNSTAIH